MSLKRLIQQNRNANCVGSTYTPHLEPIGSPPLDNTRTRTFRNSMGSWSRDYKQLALCRTTSLGDSSNPQRKSLKIFKEDNETFGFEIQHLYNAISVIDRLFGFSTIVTALWKPARSVLANINGVSTEGLGHKHVVDLIKSSGNLLRLVTVNEALLLKKMELETKLRCLKHALQEKLVEFESLNLREHHLVNAEENGGSPLDSLGLEESNLFAEPIGSGSALTSKPRFSSESSCLSQLSSMTLDSEDSYYQACVFEDSENGSFSRQSSTEDDCFLPRDPEAVVVKTSLRRHRSISVASAGSSSPVWDGGNASNRFGTLPRKTRKGSVRKRLLKFIPGLHRAVEEEGSRV
ncbi:hypothetical protein lerEdw1_017425 [Lerista edwardsae]|nr:hypothetical protein lerEdw1_017425 [Lerista edwardsae]